MTAERVVKKSQAGVSGWVRMRLRRGMAEE
jgi:hypothetical protein